MIPYNELRYGNWIAFGANHVSVRSLHKDTFLDDKEPHIYVDRFANFKSYCLLISQVDPIPLTPEILIKIGFKKNEEWGELDLSQRISIRFYNFNCAECDIVQDGKFIAFKNSAIIYLHQLQNLYFALTGKELNIEP